MKFDWERLRAKVSLIGTGQAGIEYRILVRMHNIAQMEALERHKAYTLMKLTGMVRFNSSSYQSEFTFRK